MMRSRIVVAFVVAAGFLAGVASAQVTRESIPGVSNFARVETTIACAGATSPAAVAEVKRLGYASIINLRLAGEQGAELEAEAAAAKAAGINYLHLPVDSAALGPAVVEQFLAAVSSPANQPAFVHCASGNRAAAFWMIKRMVVDRWEADRASAEATALGLSSEGLRKFALDYAATHAK